MYFRIHGLQKTLHKCIKSLVAEDPSPSSMVKGAKHC